MSSVILAEIQGIEPSTFRWQSFQDSLSTLLAYLRSLVAVAGDAPVLLVMSQLWHFSTTPQKITIWQVRYLAIHLSGSSLPILLLSVNYSDPIMYRRPAELDRLSLPYFFGAFAWYRSMVSRLSAECSTFELRKQNGGMPGNRTPS